MKKTKDYRLDAQKNTIKIKDVKIKSGCFREKKQISDVFN